MSSTPKDGWYVVRNSVCETLLNVIASTKYGSPNPIDLTPEQERAVLLKYMTNPDGATSYSEFASRVVMGHDCVMLPWCSMWLGIEKDGHTHS